MFESAWPHKSLILHKKWTREFYELSLAPCQGYDFLPKVTKDKNQTAQGEGAGC